MSVSVSSMCASGFSPDPTALAVAVHRALVAAVVLVAAREAVGESRRVSVVALVCRHVADVVS